MLCFQAGHCILAADHGFVLPLLPQSSDYLVAADVFDKGIKSWQTLQHGDAFTMLWDGEPYK